MFEPSMQTDNRTMHPHTATASRSACFISNSSALNSSGKGQHMRLHSRNAQAPRQSPRRGHVEQRPPLPPLRIFLSCRVLPHGHTPLVQPYLNKHQTCNLAHLNGAARGTKISESAVQTNKSEEPCHFRGVATRTPDASVATLAGRYVSRSAPFCVCGQYANLFSDRNSCTCILIMLCGQRGGSNAADTGFLAEPI
jgi:hypothetical protein